MLAYPPHMTPISPRVGTLGGQMSEAKIKKRMRIVLGPYP